MAVTDPVTTPVEAFGVPTDFVGTGAALAALIGTVTTRLVATPLELVTVTVTVSEVADDAAPF